MVDSEAEVVTEAAEVQCVVRLLEIVVDLEVTVGIPTRITPHPQPTCVNVWMDM